MKQCKLCGSTYDDRVDFCFRDGTPLAAMADVPAGQAAAGADAGVEAPSMTEEMDAPVPFAMLQKGRAGRARSDSPEAPEAPTAPTAPAAQASPSPEAEEPDAAQLPGPLATHATWLVRNADDDEEATLAGISPLAQSIELPAPPPISSEYEDLDPPTPIDSVQVTIPNFMPARVVLPAEADGAPAAAEPDPVAETPAAPAKAREPLPEPVTELPPPLTMQAPTPAPAPAREPAPAAPVTPASATGNADDDLDFPDSPGPTVDDAPEEPKKKSGMGLLILVGLGVAAVAAAALFVFGGGGTKTHDPEKPAEVAKVEPPPVEATKVEPPPVEAPPVEAPPTEAPPVEAPPTEAPPTEAPPAEAAPAEATPKTPATTTAKTPATTTTAKTPATGTSTARTTAANTGGGATEDSPWGVSTPAAAKSKLSVVSTPAGARVFVDDKNVGQTPLSTEIEYGLYIVRLELDGHRATSQTLKVSDASSSLKFTLDPILPTGQVNLFVPASGGGTAEVWLGERKLGNAPAMTRLEEGTYTFRVVLSNGTTFSQTKEIKFEKPGQPVTVTLSGG